MKLATYDEFTTLKPVCRAAERQPQMKAMTYARYGALHGVTLASVATPVVGDDDVLVRVRAAGLHVGDVFGVKGEPLLMRVATGLFKPKHGIPGFDLAGTVEAVGRNVSRFRRGDEVFGAGVATCAEYAIVEEDLLALKPYNLSFEHAAGLATSGLAALHALRDVADVRPGQRVLINGASGGVGHFAVQIAKAFGAEVTGVCGPHNVDMVRALGAHHVIDYTRRDFTEAGPHYDLIFDNVENRSLSECRRALAPTGMLILNSGTGARGLAMFVRLLKPLVVSPFVRHKLRRYLSQPNHEDLDALRRLTESGELSPIISKSFALAETVDALQHIDTGRARGKVVVRVCPL